MKIVSKEYMDQSGVKLTDEEYERAKLIDAIEECHILDMQFSISPMTPSFIPLNSFGHSSYIQGLPDPPRITITMTLSPKDGMIFYQDAERDDEENS